LANKERIRWSLVVIRGADKNVKQFRVSKRTVIAAPTVLLLAVTGCFAVLQLRSGAMIGELESRIAGQSEAHAAAIGRKEGQIRQLEEKVGLLGRHSEDMKAKLQDLYALEAKLKRFIDTYGGGSDARAGTGRAGSDAGMSAEAADARAMRAGSAADREDEQQLGYGGPLPPPPASATAADMLAALGGDAPDFRRLAGMIDAMTASMEYQLEQARLHKAAADAIPSGWPTSSRKLTSGFGYRTDPFTGRAAFHAGIDLAGRTGDPVYAAADGTVDEQGFDRSRGNYVTLKHRNGLKSVYMHLKRADVEEGDEVLRGEQIGQLGSTGRSTGPHLHFEILQDDEAVNPIRYLRLIKED